jgi:hypothetical protein
MSTKICVQEYSLSFIHNCPKLEAAQILTSKTNEWWGNYISCSRILHWNKTWIVDTHNKMNEFYRQVSERSQTQNSSNYMIPYIWSSKRAKCNQWWQKSGWLSHLQGGYKPGLDRNLFGGTKKGFRLFVVVCGFVCLFLVFWNRVSLFSPGWLQTCDSPSPW